MAKYAIHNIDALADKMRTTSSVINKAASLAINKTATYTREISARRIVNEVTLPIAYVNRHLKTVARASPNNLRAKISANARATLLTRYPYSVTSEGVHVRINQKGARRFIKDAFVISGLRGSGAEGVVLRNRQAVAYFTKALRDGEGATPGKRAKLAAIRAKAAAKPYGVTVLHSRSINQLFTSVREDVQPEVNDFMKSEFLKDLKRLRN